MLSTKEIKELLASLKTLFGDKFGFLEYLSLLTPILLFIGWGINKYYRARVAEKTRRDLHPYLDEDEIKKSTDHFIHTQCQDRPPEIDDEPSDGIEVANRSQLVRFFLKQAFKTNKQRFYLILGDAGMGKTTFMVNLFLKYNKGLFPKDYQIKYIPLGDIDADNQIAKLEKDAYSTILLLDAFDEDPKAVDDWQVRLNDIVSSVQKFRKVIITCRTQFFPNEESERFTIEINKFGGNGGIHRINKKYLSPFTDEEIRRYLNKRYGRSYTLDQKWLYSNSKRVKAQQLIDMAPSLAVRPMLLDKVDDLLGSTKIFKYECQVFEELVTLWIIREYEKPYARLHKDFFNHMSKILLYVAMKIYDNFHEGHGLFIDPTQIRLIAIEYSIMINDVKMAAKSLLNRNPKGMVKFSHKTILEYFLAKVDVSNLKEIDFTSFNFGLKLRNQMLINNIKQGIIKTFTNRGAGLYKSLTQFDDFILAEIDSLVLSHTPLATDLARFRVFPILRKIFIVDLNEVSLENVSTLSFTEISYNDYWSSIGGTIRLRLNVAGTDKIIDTVYRVENCPIPFKYQILRITDRRPKENERVYELQ